MSLYTDSNVMLWKYKVTSIKLIDEEGEEHDLPTIRLKEMQIIEDYDHFVMPIFKIVMILEPSMYYKILQNKNSGKVYLRIDKFYTKPNEKEGSLHHKFIDDTFDLILDDSTDDLLYSQNAQINESDYSHIVKSDLNKLKMVANEIEFYIFKTKSLEGIKEKNVNVILKDATITDAIGYLVTKAKINNVLFATPDNISEYDIILIPPLSVLKAFQYLDLYYGLYKTGSIIYFGINYVYIIPFNGNCEAYTSEENRKTTVIIPKTSDIFHTNSLGELNKGEGVNRYLVGDYKTLSARNESITNNYIVGNDADLIDSYTGESIVNLSNATTKTKNFLRLLENKTENKYIANMYTAQTRAGSSVISLSFQDIDISCIAPNKEFQILFEDTKFSEKYKGKYMISNATHTFTNNGLCMLESTTCEFRSAGSDINFNNKE